MQSKYFTNFGNYKYQLFLQTVKHNWQFEIICFNSSTFNTTQNHKLSPNQLFCLIKLIPKLLNHQKINKYKLQLPSAVHSFSSYFIKQIKLWIS